MRNNEADAWKIKARKRQYFKVFRDRFWSRQYGFISCPDLRSTEQNYNMIDGLLNNGPALPPQPPEKELDKVKEPPNKHRSREREER